MFTVRNTEARPRQDLSQGSNSLTVDQPFASIASGSEVIRDFASHILLGSPRTQCTEETSNGLWLENVPPSGEIVPTARKAKDGQDR